jgi:hypothetical protein
VAGTYTVTITRNGVASTASTTVALQPAQTFYQDIDNDGYGNGAVSVTACTAPSGYVSQSGDCNDKNAAVKPGAAEICDGMDNDCDGQTDEDFSPIAYYQDYDKDGYGNAAVSKMACVQPVGYVLNNTDCNDRSNTIYPSAPEFCDKKDNDCDGLIDEELPTQTYYKDGDKDGYGSTVKVIACAQPVGYVSVNGDCNDVNAAIYPGAPELCDGLDNDCDGVVDDGLSLRTFYRDYDKDGYGTSATTLLACAAPSGYVGVSGDCNDRNAEISPAAPELCNGIDDNCNGTIDDSLALKPFYYDYDKDGYGGATTKQACAAPPGYVSLGGDCNDKNAAVNPGRPEVAGNGVDDNCNSKTDEVTMAAARAFDIAEQGALKAYASPNPSRSSFEIRAQSSSNSPLQVRITDGAGQVITYKNGLAPQQTIRLGAAYQPGIYYVEIRQGTEKTTLKLVKLGN